GVLPGKVLQGVRILISTPRATMIRTKVCDFRRCIIFLFSAFSVYQLVLGCWLPTFSATMSNIGSLGFIQRIVRTTLLHVVYLQQQQHVSPLQRSTHDDTQRCLISVPCS
ncbi:unnamed protein product, partial [Pylaiella littoralis]